MSIDLVPLEQEGRLNAFMSFGKAVGWAVTSAITGTLLVLFGTQVTGIVCGLGAAVIFVFLVLVREREVSVWIMMIPISMVFALSLAMSICSPGESATQFAIYMSVSNMGSASGSAIYGAVSGFASWPQGYALMGLMGFLLLFAILMFRTHGHPEQMLQGSLAKQGD